MQEPMRFVSFNILWLLGLLPFCVILLLVLRFAAKLKWLTAICLSVFAVTILFILGIRIMPGPWEHVSFVSLLPGAVCAVIMIIEFFRWVISVDDTIVNTAERDRILKMVEDGKINTEEGTELLDAMGRSSALRGEEKFSRVDIVMLVAISMVILGFFLPWAHIRLPQVAGMFGKSGSAFQAGNHAGALGWAVFIIAILSVIPVFVTPKNYLYKISMLQIFLTIIGIVLVISILFRVGDRLGIGLIICLFGFIFSLLASRAKYRKLAA